MAGSGPYQRDTYLPNSVKAENRGSKIRFSSSSPESCRWPLNSACGRRSELTRESRREQKRISSLPPSDLTGRRKLMNNLVVAPSFNGRTADSGSAYRGSNPWGAAKPLSDFYSRSSEYHRISISIRSQKQPALILNHFSRSTDMLIQSQMSPISPSSALCGILDSRVELFRATKYRRHSRK